MHVSRVDSRGSVNKEFREQSATRWAPTRPGTADFHFSTANSFSRCAINLITRQPASLLHSPTVRNSFTNFSPSHTHTHPSVHPPARARARARTRVMHTNVYSAEYAKNGARAPKERREGTRERGIAGGRGRGGGGRSSTSST